MITPEALRRQLVAFLMSLAAALSTAHAQQPADTVPEGGSKWMVGGTVMLPRGADGAANVFAAVGLTTATMRSGALGADMAFVIVPSALLSGALAVGVRANVAIPLRVGNNALLTPSAGLSLIGVGGSGGAGGLRGLNGSLALVVFPTPLKTETKSVGLRVALVAHQFGSGPDGRLQMFEFGLVRRSR